MARAKVATDWRMGVGVLFFAAFVLYPLGRLFLELPGSGAFGSDLAETLATPLANTGTAVHLGMLLPLLVPPFVSAVAWLRAFGPSGLLDDVFGIAWAGVEGAFGVTVLIALNAAPVAYLVVRAGLRTRVPRSIRGAPGGGVSANGEKGV